MADTPTSSLADGPPPEAAALLSRMLQIRYFEDAVQKLFSRNLVRGSTHLCQGQEGVEVGVCSVLTQQDTMTCTYRGHGAVIAKGAPLDRCFGEILGRAEGLCGGRGGSMHFTDISIGALGANAIVGAQLPIAVGAALSAQQLGTGTVTVTFLGDGATNIGAFHESVNLAAVWKLPVVFVIENNQYGEYSPLSTTTPITRLTERASSYGIPGIFVDGNDIRAVQETTSRAVARAREGAGPTLIEADTYRQQGHSRSDPATYRPEGELERWLARDPILLLEKAMVSADVGAGDLIAQIRENAMTDVLSAQERALLWDEAPSDDRLKDVYA